MKISTNKTDLEVTRTSGASIFIDQGFFLFKKATPDKMKKTLAGCWELNSGCKMSDHINEFDAR